MRILPTFVVALLLASAVLAGCSGKAAAKPDCAALISQAKGTNSAHTNVAIETPLGTFRVELFDDASPVTAKNFKTYVKESYYDHVLIHRLIKGFMMQAGKFDNVTKQPKTPTHPPIELEASQSGCLNKHYTLSMARAGGPDTKTATTEFFTNFRDNTALDPTGPGTGYAVFGVVYDGRSVVDALENTPVHSFRDSQKDPLCQGPEASPNCPNTPVEMISVKVI